MNTAAAFGGLLELRAGKGDGRGTAAAWGSLVAWGDGKDHSISLTNLEEPGQSKIGNFAGEFLSHQDVSGRQVPVDNVLLLQVPHPICHLAGDVEQVGGAQGLPFRTCYPDNPSVGHNLATSVLVKETLCQQHGTRAMCKTSNWKSCLTVLVVLRGKFSIAVCSSGMGLG